MPSRHRSIHLKRGDALLPDTLRACCSIALKKLIECLSRNELVEDRGHLFKVALAPFLYSKAQAEVGPTEKMLRLRVHPIVAHTPAKPAH